MPRIPNPRYAKIGESPFEEPTISVDIFDAIERYIDARFRCTVQVCGDAGYELEKIEAENQLRQVLDCVVVARDE